MVRFFGDLDPALSDVLRSLLEPGDVVLDIGANIGVMSLQAASRVGPGGHVFAFEPINRLADLLSRSAAENHFENITIHRVALSDHSGPGRMRLTPASLGTSSLTLAADGEPCEMKTLDEIVFPSNFTRPKLLKIDVEGHEAIVFSGGSSFFEKYRPNYVLFESQAVNGPFWDRREVKVLRHYGYQFSVILRSMLGKPILREIAPTDSTFSSYDFLATCGDGID
jgi:FkbM family methyltransferase